MRRGLVHVLAWLLATGAAVTLSWWGVHTVMTGTAYDPPRALPITVAGATAQETRPLASSTQRPEPSRSAPNRPSPSAKPSTAPSKSAPASSSPTPSSPAPSSAPTPSGQVKSYDSDGGRVVFDIAATYGTLVSATPNTGWSMQVWKTDTYIRVEFTSGADRVSVFCDWHDGPPHVDIGTY
ncbi:hypothetical protein ACWGKW_03590 [Streptomyces sp. NPDC054766]|uniref:hypothetical protein n=1 Tax=Streptomyces rhizosphaerihabitans TaxID=1266770 RepID=UPI0021C1C45C|nr:hypothetical protein [Streptomyces rhizosphaerihabitans]MCT9005186.1 hypothetical protein [Streptomyces rhizosphaerihabitans]